MLGSIHAPKLINCDRFLGQCDAVIGAVRALARAFERWNKKCAVSVNLPSLQILHCTLVRYFLDIRPLSV